MSGDRSASSAAVRLAYLTSQYPATSHTFIRREVAALRENGVTIDTFSVRPPSASELVAEVDRREASRTFYILGQGILPFFAAHAATLLRRPLRYASTVALALRHRPPGLRGLLLSFAHFAESVVLARELQRRRLHHLHNHFANSAATVGLLATRLTGIGWSFTMHGISETDYPAGLLLPDKIRAADLVVCVSWFGQAQAMRLVEPTHWSKFRVVRCGLPLAELPEPTKHNETPKTILCVGRLSAEKGQAGLFEAFAKSGLARSGAQLRLIGEGPERARLQELASELGMMEAITFLGRLPEDETLREIAQADMLVLPSFMEGLPIVLMEAMALGVPVIASRVAGIPELVRDRENGLLFAPSDWDELAACMRQLMSDQQLCERLSLEAQRTIQAQFDSHNSARQLVELFNRLPGGKVTSRGSGA